MAFFDKLNVIVTERDFFGSNDGVAISHALTLCRTHTIEVDHAGRLVARIPKGARFHGAIEVEFGAPGRIRTSKG